jgi:uncharacterized protein YdgA (DUF945 family)
VLTDEEPAIRLPKLSPKKKQLRQTNERYYMPKINVRALQLSTEGLLKLLGGTPAERERYWEILKGITSLADVLVVNKQIGELQASLKQANINATALQKSMKNAG